MDKEYSVHVREWLQGCLLFGDVSLYWSSYTPKGVTPVRSCREGKARSTLPLCVQHARRVAGFRPKPGKLCYMSVGHASNAH